MVKQAIKRMKLSHTAVNRRETKRCFQALIVICEFFSQITTL